MQQDKPTLPKPKIVVDLDGSLTPVDTFHESLFRAIIKSPRSIPQLVLSLFRGKASCKELVATIAGSDDLHVPLNQDLVQWLLVKRSEGHAVWLATGADERIANRVAEQLGFFDNVIASDGVQNRIGQQKLEAITDQLGEDQFWYVGNSMSDCDIWERAECIIVAGNSKRVRKAANAIQEISWEFPSASVSARDILSALRTHQWVKNILVFLPAIASHRWNNPEAVYATSGMFVAFCLAASSVYLLNDCVDLRTDRAHPEKRNRPIAAGEFLLPHAVALAVFLGVVSIVIAASLGLKAVPCIVGYFFLNGAYSLGLKKRMLVDVFLLTSFYLIRIFSGGVASGIEVSHWLIGFAGFFFLSLAFTKRQTEILRVASSTTLKSRGYRKEDSQFLGACSIASGFASVLILSLYCNSQIAMTLYQENKLIWLWLPAILYWQMRVWLIASRGELKYDPVAFAVKDRITYAVGAIILLITYLAA